MRVVVEEEQGESEEGEGTPHTTYVLAMPGGCIEAFAVGFY